MSVNWCFVLIISGGEWIGRCFGWLVKLVMVMNRLSGCLLGSKWGLCDLVFIVVNVLSSILLNILFLNGGLN